jgi:hydrogenase maturation protein HypF
LAGWVLNAEEGVEIHLEGAEPALDAFVNDLRQHTPPAAHIIAIDIHSVAPTGLVEFSIRESLCRARPSVRISPDLPVCQECLDELLDPTDRRHKYPYINCTNCGPRYTIVSALPYDRENTTMRNWPLDAYCAHQYDDPSDRRFHAQPVSCPQCGPHYFLRAGDERIDGDDASVRRAVEPLQHGSIVAVKGLGGYHLACDARNAEGVSALRERKYRKEKPFAIMARDLDAVRVLIEVTPESEALLLAMARPILLAPAKIEMPGVAPESGELGVMLPYTPLHHLLFAAGAPEALIMTSANRSSEPIAYEDEEAVTQLAGIADAFLVGQRAIARRVDDSVVRVGSFGPMILRRGRGYAPGAVARLPSRQPMLAVGGDLKNTVTLVLEGQAFVGEHIGDLENYQSLRSFRRTIADLMAMYEVTWSDTVVVCDRHPQYASTAYALALPASEKVSVQHHRAHIASVVAEREAWEEPVIGLSLDGTGYGDDGAIWGGEIFAGNVACGFKRVAHLRYASLAGGDAAARHPVQAAAGFLAQLDCLPDLSAAPFFFPERYEASRLLASKGLRMFPTTSVGRLFDAAAALLGFTRPITFEGQAAMWLEYIARGAAPGAAYPFPLSTTELDFRPLLRALVHDRLRGRDQSEIARAFQWGLAEGFSAAAKILCEQRGINTVALSGGVFQNAMLLEDIKRSFSTSRLRLWTNHSVPPNDGGISLGQAALAAFGQFEKIHA